MILTHLNLVINETDLCDWSVTKKQLFETLKSRYNDKSPRNDGLPKGFYVRVWDSLEELLIN